MVDLTERENLLLEEAANNKIDGIWDSIVPYQTDSGTFYRYYYLDDQYYLNYYDSLNYLGYELIKP
jgi:hypothetical protein